MWKTYTLKTKTLLKDLNGERYHDHNSEDNIVKITVIPKSIDSTQSQLYQVSFFIEMDKLILKFIWKCKGPKTLILPDFKTGK